MHGKVKTGRNLMLASFQYKLFTNIQNLKLFGNEFSLIKRKVRQRNLGKAYFNLYSDADQNHAVY